MAQALTYRDHVRALMLLGLPLIGSHLAQMAIGITDNVMLGWYAVEALAAVTLGFSAYFLLFILGSGFALAILPMVTNALADGDEVRARRVTRMGLWASTAYGAVVMVPLFFSEPILIAMGQTPLIAGLAADYLAIVALGMIPSLWVMVLKSYLAAQERTQVVLWVTVAAAVLNGVLNWVLIFGKFGAPELGLKGAAIASVAMQVASLLMFAIYIQRVAPEHRLFQRIWRADPEALSRVFRLGWPIGLTHLAEAGMFSASALMMGWLGKLPLAAHGVGIQLASVTFVVHLGLSQAATVRIGQAHSRRDPVMLRDGAVTVMALSVLFALVTVAAFLLVPEFLIGLFLDPGDPDRAAIIAIGVGLLAVAALFQLVDGAQVIGLGLLRGLEDTKTPMIMASFSYWGIGLPASYLFGFVLEWGGKGIWFGLVLGLGSAAVLLLWRFVRIGLRPANA